MSLTSLNNRAATAQAQGGGRAAPVKIKGDRAIFGQLPGGACYNQTTRCLDGACSATGLFRGGGKGIWKWPSGDSQAAFREASGFCKDRTDTGCLWFKTWYRNIKSRVLMIYRCTLCIYRPVWLQLQTKCFYPWSSRYSHLKSLGHKLYILLSLCNIK